MHMRAKTNTIMPKMAPIIGPAEAFGEESSRRERFRGGEGRGIMLRDVLWIQINTALLILSNNSSTNNNLVAVLPLEGS